jgi:hypothetical protein
MVCSSFILQPIPYVLTGENAFPEYRVSAYGMLNLIVEIGALSVSVISGALRNSMEVGQWP